MTFQVTVLRKGNTKEDFQNLKIESPNPENKRNLLKKHISYPFLKNDGSLVTKNLIFTLRNRNGEKVDGIDREDTKRGGDSYNTNYLECKSWKKDYIRETVIKLKQKKGFLKITVIGVSNVV